MDMEQDDPIEKKEDVSEADKAASEAYRPRQDAVEELESEEEV